MPTKHHGAPRQDPTRQLLESVQQLTSVVDRFTSDLDAVRDEQQLQLKRTAQLQAELDTIKRAWEKMQSTA